MKKLLILLIIPCLSFGQDVYDDLLYYYSFSENGNFLAADATGNNFTATLNDVENTTDRFGNENSAKFFNGESSFISIPYQSIALAPFPISYSFWVKLDSVGHVGGVVRNEFIENYYTGCWVDILPESISMGYGNCGTAGSQSRVSKTLNHFFLDEQWHHVVAVFEDAIDIFSPYSEMTMYINGALTGGDYTGTGSALCYGSGDYLGWAMNDDAIESNGGLDWGGTIGRVDANTPASPLGDTIYHFKGSLDEIGYWTRALSADEVLEIYQNGLFDECQGGPVDECGICNGPGPQIMCWDGNMVCSELDCSEQSGCMDEVACNYNSEATQDDLSCAFPGDPCELDNGTMGGYNDLCECIEVNSSINEYNSHKILIKVVDLLGRETTNKGFQLEIYDDGSVEKKYLIH